MKEETEALHWADKAARGIIKEKGEKKRYVIAAGITPSGVVHIGNFREIITIELINRALKDLGKDVRFIYSWDDYDVFRKVPVNMPKQELLKKYLRMPIIDVPDTKECKHNSYAEHNEKSVEEVLPVVGINPEYIYQNKKYKKCNYAEEMKTALQKRAVIKDILDKYRKEPLGRDWYPVTIFCKKCKKDTTKITNYDGKYAVNYACKCGFEDTLDIRKDGIIKLLWRIDWPMRWYHEKVDFESGGKDHFAAGGSFDTGKQIVKEVYGYDAPFSIRFEWISVKGGKQFSSSAGIVITLQQALEVYEPCILRYLFAGTRPEAEFAISFDLDVLKLYEDFDKCERIYFKKEEVDKKEFEKQKRIYELSSVDIPKRSPYQPSFRHLTCVLQVYGKDLKRATESFKGFLKTKEDKERFETRLRCALNWLEKYAPEEFRFNVQEKVPRDLKLDKKQIDALHRVAGLLKEKKLTEVELHNRFYEICKEMGLNPKEFFKAAYLVLLNKERGPRLASFILILGKEKVAGLFEHI